MLACAFREIKKITIIGKYFINYNFAAKVATPHAIYIKKCNEIGKSGSETNLYLNL
jgi:hypothetical protein